MGLDNDVDVVDGRRRLARWRYVVYDDDGTMLQQPGLLEVALILLSMLGGNLIDSSLILDLNY